MSQETVKSLSAEQLETELQRLIQGKRAQLVLRDAAHADKPITVTYEQASAQFVMVQPGGAKTCTTQSSWCRDFLRKNHYFYIVETPQVDYWRITNIYDASSPRRLREAFLDVIMPEQSYSEQVFHSVRSQVQSSPVVFVVLVRQRTVVYGRVYLCTAGEMRIRMWDAVTCKWATESQRFAYVRDQAMRVLPFDPSNLLHGFDSYRKLLHDLQAAPVERVYEGLNWRFRQNAERGCVEYTMLTKKGESYSYAPVANEMILSEKGFLGHFKHGAVKPIEQPAAQSKEQPVVKQDTDKLREQIQTAQRDLSVSLHELFNDLTEAGDELDEVLYRKQFSGGWLRFLNLGKQSARTWLIQYRAREQDKWVMLVACDDNPWQLVDTVREQEMLGIGEKFLPPA